MYGTDWIQVRVSASFSVARCSRPICGSARWTTSPSSSSTRRKTPCAAGCCGPKFRVKLRISAMCRIPVGFFAHDARGVFARLDGYRLVNHTRLIRVVTHFDMTGDREILAERVANETIIGQDATQVVMAHEGDTEQVKGLALEPVRRGPHTSHRINRRETFILGKHPDTQTNIPGYRQQMND